MTVAGIIAVGNGTSWGHSLLAAATMAGIVIGFLIYAFLFVWFVDEHSGWWCVLILATAFVALVVAQHGGI